MGTLFIIISLLIPDGSNSNRRDILRATFGSRWRDEHQRSYLHVPH